MPKANLQLPQGTEAFYLEEAYVHRRLVRTFEDRCGLWAYLPVETPVYDFHELYRGLLDPAREATTYRLVDRAGDLLVLRSDITLFLARQMGLVLDARDLPVRVYYGDTILRHEDAHDISKNEYFQVGAELIGATGLAADAEIVLLLLDALDHWAQTDVVVHLGHRALLREHNADGRLAPAVARRDWTEVRAILEERKLTPERINALVELYGFIGTPGELRRAVDARHGIGTDERDTFNHLLSLADELEAFGYGERVRIDLSEVGSQTYHSGVVFQAYAPDAAAPIASGGRYDGLLARFGFDAPSVGFSVMLRRLQSRDRAAGHHAPPAVREPSATSFRERVLEAQRLRDQGEVVKL